mgnify:FL=1
MENLADGITNITAVLNPEMIILRWWHNGTK